MIRLFGGRTIFGPVIPSLVLMNVVSNGSAAGAQSGKVFDLPQPRTDSDVSLEQCLHTRRSVRQYSDSPLKIAEIAQLLWAAQGTASSMGYRTAPSAGALYPLETYIVAGNVEGLSPGVYRYETKRHQLIEVAAGDRRAELAKAALGQSCIRESPACVVFAAVYERTTRKYRERGIFYVHAEVGHAAQNVSLQAVSLGLGSLVIGAFYEESVQQALDLPDREDPLIIIPIGKRR